MNCLNFLDEKIIFNLNVRSVRRKENVVDSVSYKGVAKGGQLISKDYIFFTRDSPANVSLFFPNLSFV